MPQALSVSMPLVLTISTGMALVASSRDSARVAWNPFMPGSTTSIRTRSGRSARAASMPSSAFARAITWCPLRSRSWVRTAVSVGESSISRIFAMVYLSPRSGVDVRADRVEEFLARERFGDVLLGADDAAACLVEQAVLGGQHDHRRVLEQLVVLDQRAGLVAVQTRHHDVDEDDLRALVGDLGQRFEAVGGGVDFAAFAAQQRFRGAPDGLRIVDDHDPEAGKRAGWVLVVRHWCVSPCMRQLAPAMRSVLYPRPRTGCQVPAQAERGDANFVAFGACYHLRPTPAGTARMPLDVLVVMD